MIDEKAILKHAQDEYARLTAEIDKDQVELNKKHNQRNKWASVVGAFFNDQNSTNSNETEEEESPKSLTQQLTSILSAKDHPMTGKMLYEALVQQYNYKSEYVSLSGKLRVLVQEKKIKIHELKELQKKYRYWYLLPEWSNENEIIINDKHRLFIKNWIEK